MKPFFSIIIPTYNRATFLPKAIESVLSQIFINWELIVVDDGSTDHTKDVVNKYNDDRLRYIYQKNGERSAARNNGIKHAKGDYICFLDSDDYLLSDFLEKLKYEIDISQNSQQIYFFKVLVKNVNSTNVLFDVMPDCDNIVKYLIHQNTVISVSQGVIPKTFLIKNIFEERFSLWEDTHLYLRLLTQFSYKSTQIDGVVVCQHENSSVVKGMQLVNLKDINRYIEAINDLRENYWDLFKNLIEKHDFKKYIDAKLNMYLYQSRVNNQYDIAFKVALKMMRNRFNISNLITSIKLVIHYIKSCFKIK